MYKTDNTHPNFKKYLRQVKTKVKIKFKKREKTWQSAKPKQRHMFSSVNPINTVLPLVFPFECLETDPYTSFCVIETDSYTLYCVSFSPLHEHTSVRHSLKTYGFRVSLLYFTAIVKGVIALNVGCSKR